MHCISRKDGSIFTGNVCHYQTNKAAANLLAGDRLLLETNLKGASSAFWQERENSIKELGKIGSPEAVPVLIKILQSVQDKRSSLSYRDRMFAAEALGGIGDRGAIAALMDALEERNIFVRYSALKALERIGFAFDERFRAAVAEGKLLFEG